MTVMTDDGNNMNMNMNTDETSSRCKAFWGCTWFSSNNSLMFRIGVVLEICLLLTFCGFTLYALVEGNTDGVRAACPKLWEFMAARSVAAIVVMMIFILVYIYTLNYASNTEKNPEWAKMDQRSPFTTQTLMHILLLAMLLYYGAFFVSGICIIPTNIPNSQLCSDTLSMTVATGTPILGITAWITCIMDGLLTICIGIILAFYIFKSPAVAS